MKQTASDFSDFREAEHNDEVGPAAVGQNANDFWTGAYFPYSTYSTINNLLWSDHTPSGINLAIANAPGDWANGASDPMFSTYTYVYNGDITVTLTGVPAGTYDLYLYGHGPATDNSIFTVTSPANSQGTLLTTPSGTAWQSTTWAEGVAVRRLPWAERFKRPIGHGGRAGGLAVVRADCRFATGAG